MGRLFGEWVKKERKKQGLTVQALASASELSRSYITLIENGKRLPGKKTLPKLAAALHLKPATILNWYLEDIGKKIQQDLDIPNE